MGLSANTLLIVDDDDNMRALVNDVLCSRGFVASEASDGVQAIKLFREQKFDAVLLDMRMPRMGGLDALREIKKIDADTPVIIITAHADVSDAVNAIKLGAYDFIVKPPDFDHLLIMLNHAIERGGLSREYKKLDAAIDSSLESFLGAGGGMKKVIDQMKQVASSDFSIIIQGETGTGKTTVASSIHNMSKRSRNPFVTVDVGSMPETLVESELFGYEKGAFTGAERKKKGFFEIAEGGTILIDDLQNVSLYTQSKLLRAVEEKKFSPVGSLLSCDVDVRIIVAMNMDAHKAVRENKLKQDLFFRLSEFIITIPPLRERTDDIPFLGRKFMVEAAGELNKPMRELAEDAIALLKKYDWPGNVRELKNVMRRAVLIAESDCITSSHLEFLIGRGYGAKSYSPMLQGELPTLSLKDLELLAIRKALEVTGNNKTEAAAVLQIDASTLHRKIKQFNI